MLPLVGGDICYLTTARASFFETVIVLALTVIIDAAKMNKSKIRFIGDVLKLAGKINYSKDNRKSTKSSVCGEEL